MEKKYGIITCMDSRFDPISITDLPPEHTYVIRNAGGRVNADTIRSMTIAHKFMGIKEWFIIHHTDCMVGELNDEIILKALKSNLQTAEFNGHDWVNDDRFETEDNSESINKIEWQTFSDLKQSVIDDLNAIRENSLIPDTVEVKGFIYDLTGNTIDPVD